MKPLSALWCLALLPAGAAAQEKKEPEVVAPRTAAVQPAPSADKTTARVAELVRQLGDDDFDRRVEAQDALIALGPAAVTALESLPAATDPEVLYRLRAVRRAVGGPVLALREALEAHAARGDFGPEFKAGVQRVVAANSSATGDFLLSLVGDEKHKLHRPAVAAFIAGWGLMSADQVRAYLEQTLRFDIAARPAYPKGVPAMIGVGYRFEHGWGPTPDGFKIATETAHTLDGKPYGKPYLFAHTSTGCTTTWVRTADLAVGRHAFSAEVTFRATHRGTTVTGAVKSRACEFEVLPAGTPDDLIGKADPAVEKLIRASLWIAETEQGKDIVPAGAPAVDWWRPQETWAGKDGKPNGLHLPVWRLEKPLPVDLAFDVFLRIDGTDEEFPADTLVAVKGETRNLGRVFVRDPQAVARGRSGFVSVRIVLRPSRASALTNPRTTSYYPGEIVSEPLRMRVGPAEAPPR